MKYTIVMSAVIYLLIVAGVISAIGYVAIHFIAKFW